MPALGSARWAASGAALAATALLIAGCGGSAASPQPKPDSSSTSGPPSHSAGPDLHYPQQLDPSAMVKNPCSALKNSQVHEIVNAKPGDGKTQHGAGVGCGWHPASLDAPHAAIGIEWPGGEGGLTFLYSVKNERHFFQPTTLGGFPAVRTTGPSVAAKGACKVVVGVNKHMYFIADYEGRRGKSSRNEPCAQARKAAKYVIQNLRPGS